jgi:hypothetical protein
MEIGGAENSRGLKIDHRREIYQTQLLRKP